MKIGIIGAMDVEIATLKEKLHHMAIIHYANMEFYTGEIDDLPVVVSHCGVGKVNAALCVQILRDRFEITHVINTGVAGAISDDLKMNDLVICSEMIYHDVDVTAFGYAYGQLPGRKEPGYQPDPKLQKIAFSAAQKVNEERAFLGRIASGDQFVSTTDQKYRISERTAAICAEMEGTAIAQACEQNALPFVVIRAISDTADESVTWDYFEEIAARQCTEVTLRVIRRLAEINHLIEMA